VSDDHKFVVCGDDCCPWCEGYEAGWKAAREEIAAKQGWILDDE
jgi:hypothetical protein